MTGVTAKTRCGIRTISSLGARPPNPRSFPLWAKRLSTPRKRGHAAASRDTARSLEPRWQRLPLRLPSGRAVSCTRHPPSHPTPAAKAISIFTPNAEFRFCSISSPLLNRLCSLLNRPRQETTKGPLFSCVHVADGWL